MILVLALITLDASDPLDSVRVDWELDFHLNARLHDEIMSPLLDHGLVDQDLVVVSADLYIIVG